MIRLVDDVGRADDTLERAADATMRADNERGRSGDASFTTQALVARRLPLAFFTPAIAWGCRTAREVSAGG
jgi:hypothetical protein